MDKEKIEQKSNILLSFSYIKTQLSELHVTLNEN